MTMDELLRNYPGCNEEDEDYQYELYKENQEREMERLAYEEMNSDKY